MAEWGNCQIGSTFCLRKKFHKAERIMICPYVICPSLKDPKTQARFHRNLDRSELASWRTEENVCFFFPRGRRRPDPFVLVSQYRLK